MSGVLVLPSLGEAIRDGWQVLDRTADGYLLRRRSGDRWVMALCQPKQVEHISPPSEYDQEC